MNFVFLLFALFPFPQEVSEEALRKHITTLASDSFEGRCAGKPGSKRAAVYIENQFKEAGIRPFTNRYQQPFLISSFIDSRDQIGSTNVVAVLPGSDPKLRTEFVIVGAHYDGPGKTGDPNDIIRLRSSDREDQIWNGADDNASGVAVLLEAGKILSSLKCRRSILLVAFGGEEFGNFGSMRFLQALPRSEDLDPFTAMVNLHMVGRGERRVTVLSTRTSKRWSSLVEGAARGVIKFRCPKEISETGDQASFYGRKIPAIKVFGGFHEFLYTPEDEVEKIDFPLLALRTRFVVRLVQKVANLQERLVWSGPAPPPRVGLEGQDVGDQDAEVLGLPKGQGGIRVQDVMPGEPAARAGIQVGDVILQFGSVVLSRDGALARMRDAIRESRKQARVPIRVLREGKELLLEIVW